MIKNYIRKDEKYLYFRLVKNDLYELIERDGRLTSLIDGVFHYSKKQKSGVDISKKEIKRYLAWRIFENHGCSIEKFHREVPKENLCELIYFDFSLFHGE